MSTSIMAQVWPLQLPPVAKSVLVSLADNANDTGFCWPSIETICERTCYGRTAVIDAIKWLGDHEYLQADRSNGRKTTYQLTPGKGKNTPREAEQPVRLANQSASRTGTPDGLNQSASRTKPVRQADTNRQEPSRTVNKSYVTELPADVQPEVWAMWHEYRLKKSGKAWTEHAQRLSVKAMLRIVANGHDLRAVVETSIERGYSGLFEPKPAAGAVRDKSPADRAMRLYRESQQRAGGLMELGHD